MRTSVLGLRGSSPSPATMWKPSRRRSSPPSAASPALASAWFGRFSDTTTRSDSSRTCVPGLRIRSFPVRSRRWLLPDMREVSRFPSMECPCVLGFPDYAGPRPRLALAAPRVWPSPYTNSAPQRAAASSSAGHREGRVPSANARTGVPAPPAGAPLGALHDIRGPHASTLADMRRRAAGPATLAGNGDVCGIAPGAFRP